MKQFKKKHKNLVILLITAATVALFATSVGAKPTLSFDLGSTFKFPPWESLQQYIQKRQSDQTKGFR